MKKAELIVDADIIDKKRMYIKRFSAPSFTHPLHFHQLCELTWIQKGEGTLFVGDFVGNYFEGDLILVGPGLPHLYKSDVKNSIDTKCISIYFPSFWLQQLSDELAVQQSLQELLSNAQRGIKITGKTKEHVLTKIRELQGNTALGKMALFFSILDIVQRKKEYTLLAGPVYKNTYNHKDIERFNALYDFVLTNFYREIRLEEVAAICHLVPASFSRYFKARTQKSFVNFLNEIRIGHACKLLQHQTIPLKIVGYECGYNNPVNFYKSFKSIMKMTPRSYSKLWNTSGG